MKHELSIHLMVTPTRWLTHISLSCFLTVPQQVVISEVVVVMVRRQIV